MFSRTFISLLAIAVLAPGSAFAQGADAKSLDQRAQRDRGIQRRARARTCRADDGRTSLVNRSPSAHRSAPPRGGLPEDDEREKTPL